MFEYICYIVLVYLIIGVGVTISVAKDEIVRAFKKGEWLQSLTAIAATSSMYLPMMLIALWQEIKKEKK